MPLFVFVKFQKKSLENATKIIDAGGAPIIVEFITNSNGDTILNGIFTLGYIASFKKSLVTEIIKAKAIYQLNKSLQNESKQSIKAAAFYALGKIGMHSNEYAKEVSDANVLHLILSYYKTADSNEQLKEQAKKALKVIIVQCSNLTAQKPLIKKAPYDILEYILYLHMKRSNLFKTKD